MAVRIDDLASYIHREWATVLAGKLALRCRVQPVQVGFLTGYAQRDLLVYPPSSPLTL
jgi:hypothetical protein